MPANKIRRQPSRIARKVSRLAFSRVKVLIPEEAPMTHVETWTMIIREHNCQRELYIAPLFPFDIIAKILTRVILHR